MSPVTTEAEWLSCDEPDRLAHHVRDCMDIQRFRWLAVEWGRRVRHLFETDDLPWFDAYAAWVAEKGDHPNQVCRDREWYPLDRPQSAIAYVRFSADAIRHNNPLDVAAFAGLAASEDYIQFIPKIVDFTKTHRGRSKTKRAIETVTQQARSAAIQEQLARVRVEFCHQFRDVAGNPFRSVAFRSEWLTSDVVGLASAIDATGYFDRLPILADALEEAGCTPEDILRHCRDETTHVRGCWVIDNLLGRVKPVQV